MQLEEYLERDDRVVLPVGSTEQHAYLSLETDNVIAERLAIEAAEPLGIPVLPVLAYGVTGFYMFPGSPTLRPETFGAGVRDIFDLLHAPGGQYRRCLAGSAGRRLVRRPLPAARRRCSARLEPGRRSAARAARLRLALAADFSGERDGGNRLKLLAHVV